MLKLVRAAEAPPEPKPPIQIEIVNAADFQKDKVLTVKRDDTGKMTGAAVESVT